MNGENTKVDIFTDEDGDLHYNFTIDGQHLEIMRTLPFDQAEAEGWRWIQSLPGTDEEVGFYKKAFTFHIMIRMLMRMSSSPAPAVPTEETNVPEDNA